MHKFKFFTYFLLLAITPSLLVYPQNNLSSSQMQKVHLENTESNDIWFYEEDIHLLYELESGALEKRFTYADLEWINSSLVLLAKLGHLPDDSKDLSDDVEELLNTYSLYHELIIPTVLNDDELSAWIQKKWETPKKFVKKHKKALIIGTAIATAIGAIMKEEAHQVLSDTLLKKVHEDLALTALIKEEISSFKEILAKEGFFPPVNPSGQQGISWKERGKVLGSLLSHLIQNKKDTLFSTSKESDNESIYFGHLEIDYSFSTDYAHLYTTTDKKIDFTTIAYQALAEETLKNNYIDPSNF